MKADEPRPLFGFAGIYRQWKGPIKKAGPNVDIEVYSFMTTLPNTLTSTINHERSPVLLTTEVEYGTWLTGTPEEAFGLIKTSDPDRMRIVQSGLDKEDRVTMKMAPASVGRSRGHSGRRYIDGPSPPWRKYRALLSEPYGSVARS